MSDGEEKERVLVTLGPDTVEWLNQQYPDADSTPEQVRSAIGDARRFWSKIDIGIDDS